MRQDDDEAGGISHKFPIQIKNQLVIICKHKKYGKEKYNRQDSKLTLIIRWKALFITAVNNEIVKKKKEKKK